MISWIWGLGFGVYGLGFRVLGLGFRAACGDLSKKEGCKGLQKKGICIYGNRTGLRGPHYVEIL